MQCIAMSRSKVSEKTRLSKKVVNRVHHEQVLMTCIE
jgi:hypothetical protein